MLNVKKFIINKLKGGRLKDVNPPKKDNNIKSVINFFFNLI